MQWAEMSRIWDGHPTQNCGEYPTNDCHGMTCQESGMGVPPTTQCWCQNHHLAANDSSCTVWTPTITAATELISMALSRCSASLRTGMLKHNLQQLCSQQAQVLFASALSCKPFGLVLGIAKMPCHIISILFTTKAQKCGHMGAALQSVPYLAVRIKFNLHFMPTRKKK